MPGHPLASRARRLALDLDSALARARARELDREVDRDIGLALDRAYALAGALTDGTANPPELAGSLVVALTGVRNLACTRPSARNLVRTLNRALSRARGLERALAGSRYLADLLAGLVHGLTTLVHSRAGTGSGEQHAGPHPHRTRLGLVAVALRVLPAQHRARYCDEFRAELHDMRGSGQRLRYGLRVLTRAWALRSVLRRMPPAADGAPAHRER